VAKRSKDGSIIIYVGSDAQKHLERVAKREKIASKKAEIREAKKAATKQRQALRLAGKRAAQMARAIQRERDTTARRKAAREARRNWRPDPKRKKRSVHPKGAFATEKYTSYARRYERSRSLKAFAISETEYNVNGYTVKVIEDKAISCTCPDFTQDDGGRDWKGSNAGPFNPCKHMMADRGQYYVEIRGTFLDNFGVFQSGGALGKIIRRPFQKLTVDGEAGTALSGEKAYWYKIGSERFTEAGWRLGAVSIAIYIQI